MTVRFMGWRAIACGAIAAMATTMMVQGCGGGDDSGTTGGDTPVDGGKIVFDGSTIIDATTIDSSVSDASICPSAQALCGGSCATLAKDSQNCGACGNVCPSGEACSAGKCTTDCGGGQNLCGPGDAGDAGGSYCATFSSDNANCGACGKHCGAGEICSAGSCQTTCGATQTACNVGDAGADAGHGGAPFCATLATDDSNCGACGHACSAGESCQSGSCKVTCGPTENLCASGDGTTNGTDGGAPYCANFQTDNTNCGGCGTKCAAGQVCSGGVCGTSCAPPETICASGDGLTDGTDGGAPYCANFSSDNTNCGSCGNSCGAGQACVNGSCSTTCEGDLLLCGSKCIDPNTSITNCGATAACDSDAGTSGTACPAKNSCLSGVCTPTLPYEIGSFNVANGPYWGGAPPTYSCVQACTLLFGASPLPYACSTIDGTLNHLAWGSDYGDAKHCSDGTPVADNFTNATVYNDEGDFSAYVKDNCGVPDYDETNVSINYCWVVSP